MSRAAAGAVRAMLAVLVAALVLPAVAAAQTDDAGVPEGVTITAEFRETNATIGDRVNLVVRVEHPDSIVVTVPLPALPDAEVLNSGETTIASLPDGTQVSETTFRYQVFALGPLEAGAIVVRWIDAEGTSGAFEVPGARVTVVPVRTPGDEALRPLQAQRTIEGAPPAWILPAVVAGVVVVVLPVLVLLVRRLRRPAPAIPEPVPADEIERGARERLSALKGMRLDEEAAFQRYYGTISSVVRQYLGRRFEFNATALTSTELEARMTSYGIDRWQARLVAGLLDRCDRAVYARQYPDPASADHDLTVAFEIVELSRPPVAEPSEEEPAVAAS